MLRWIARMGAVLGLSLGLLVVWHMPRPQAQGGCMSWSDARQRGLIRQLNLRPAGNVKARVEARHKGRVVSFLICGAGGGGPVTYKLVVFRADGTVINVTEPAQ